MRTLARIICLALFFSGWALAALCLHVVRTPDPMDPSRSNLVVIPKTRLGIADTYVDARFWTSADVPQHASLIGRMIDAGKASELKYLANPKSKDDVQTQLTDMLAATRSAGPRSDILGG